MLFLLLLGQALLLLIELFHFLVQIFLFLLKFGLKFRDFLLFDLKLVIQLDILLPFSEYFLL